MKNTIDQLVEKKKFINSQTNKSLLFRRNRKILVLIFISVLMGIPIILFFLNDLWQNNSNLVKNTKESANLPIKIKTFDISFPKNESSNFERIKTKNYDNGDKYIGRLRNGKFHGQGTYTWSNGNKYTGEWQNNNSNGQGTFIWANGYK